MRINHSLQEQVLASLSDAALNLILLPTEKCNFRCTYCYEDFVVGRMQSETLLGIRHLLERRAPQLSFLDIEWFGGEPMLASDIVEDISAHCCALAEQYPSLSYSAGMTTNGYFLDETAARRLRKLGIRSYQISLDGPRECHNTTRILATGKGSFDTIWNNLRSLRETGLDVKILLRIHLTPQNAESMPEFLGLVKTTFLDDPRFSVLLKPIAHLGGPNNDRIETLPQAEAQTLLGRLRRILYGDTPPWSAPYMCYASKPNSFVIRANGIIGKCTVALDDPRNHIGVLTREGTLDLNNMALRPWIRGLESLDEQTLHCPFKEMPHLSQEDGRVHPQVLFRIERSEVGAGGTSPNPA
jgi:uncharacterized protein